MVENEYRVSLLNGAALLSRGPLHEDQCGERDSKCVGNPSAAHYGLCSWHYSRCRECDGAGTLGVGTDALSTPLLCPACEGGIARDPEAETRAVALKWATVQQTQAERASLTARTAVEQADLLLATIGRDVRSGR